MNDKLQRHIRVREVMTPSPRVIDGLATVRQAVEVMREHHVSQNPAAKEALLVGEIQRPQRLQHRLILIWPACHSSSPFLWLPS